MRNRSVMISRYGGPDVLRLVEAPMPRPTEGEVRLRVRAAGVSFADVLMRAGAYPRWRYVPDVPFVPGWDVIGEVDACGEGVAASWLGQRVVALPKVGGYSEAICVPAVRTVPVPEGVDDAEAVSLVLNYVTAFQMLHRVAAVRAGERVLVNGAAGGVGSAVLELARLAGVEAFGAASSAKHAFVRQLGATPIDYRREDVPRAVRSIVGGGVDAAFDGVGGWHVLSSLRATRRGGRVVPFGVSAFVSRGERRRLGRPAGYLGFAAAAASGVVQGKRVRTYSIAHSQDAHPDWFREDLGALLRLLQEGSIRPTVAARLPLDRAAEAHALLGAAKVRGRIVLVCGSP
jgi:NADPH:quinone reductase-like Zn-dependent oxidoreductase